MTRTVCSTPRCPELAVFRGLCGRHRQSTSERGYGPTHATARLCLAETLPAPCAYGCGTILRGREFVAAHVVDGDESAGWVAACSPCNERAKFGRLQPAPGAQVVHLGARVPRGTVEVFA
jgi:hypothetical protein